MFCQLNIKQKVTLNIGRYFHFIWMNYNLLNVSVHDKLDQNILTWNFEWHIYTVRKKYLSQKTSWKLAIYKPSYLRTSRFLWPAFSSVSIPADCLVISSETWNCRLSGLGECGYKKNMIFVFSVNTCDRYLVTCNNVTFLCQW